MAPRVRQLGSWLPPKKTTGFILGQGGRHPMAGRWWPGQWWLTKVVMNAEDRRMLANTIGALNLLWPDEHE